LLKENVIEKITKHCKALGIVIAVDPKLHNFFAYKQADIFKPNLKEVREGLHISLDQVNEETLSEVHKALQEQLRHRISFITLSEKGVYYHNEQEGRIVPSHRRNIADVSGAGDTVIAVAAMVYALTKDAEKMACWSNIAGGLVCEEVGVVPINKEKLLQEIVKLEGMV
jgi:rfaE bifunctional protein kinase chain/domain